MCAWRASHIGGVSRAVVDRSAIAVRIAFLSVTRSQTHGRDCWLEVQLPTIVAAAFGCSCYVLIFRWVAVAPFSLPLPKCPLNSAFRYPNLVASPSAQQKCRTELR